MQEKKKKEGWYKECTLLIVYYSGIYNVDLTCVEARASGKTEFLIKFLALHTYTLINRALWSSRSTPGPTLLRANDPQYY